MKDFWLETASEFLQVAFLIFLICATTHFPSGFHPAVILLLWMIYNKKASGE